MLGQPPGRRTGHQAGLLTGWLWPRLRGSPAARGVPSPPSPLASLSSGTSAAQSLGHGLFHIAKTI